MPLRAEISSFIREEALKRFLSYVPVHTSSDEKTGTYPSTKRQFALGEMLRAELLALGARDVELDEHCYLYATLPPSPAAAGPAITFLAHLDTSWSVSGESVKPLVHEAYTGEAITFPEDPELTLTPADSPELELFRGDDLVTASGSTLLGADDKAGIAEIMAAVAAFRRYPELPHPELRICFTPDEEIGGGTAKIRISRLGKVAYTLDGGIVGELETECFDARRVVIRFRGMNMHPGYAKDRMVNAALVAARFMAGLPEWQAPEHAEGREGFYHLTRIGGDESEATLELIVRDFAASANDRRIELLRAQRDLFLLRHPGLRIDLETTEQYRNMKEVLDKHAPVVEAARRAIEEAGITVIQRAIRGGTDGARLCFMGLPTPNIFTGGMLPHSRREWIPATGLEKATEVIIRLAGRWSSEKL